MCCSIVWFFFFQAEDGIRDLVRSRGLGDVYKRQPYMGIDSIKPFFGFKDKCVFVLALTSNPGSDDFQRLVFGNEALYKIVIKKCLNAFGDNGDLGFVIGATHPDELAEVRELVGNNVPLLIPGVGAQGGSSTCLLYTSPSPRDRTRSRMPSSA